ncbi:hypothetical protein BC832DRAFT_405882 [Gaertneriomyces semiglobifer]|nr:hypothetical protein BC832DRAFT_405882 [Gaertneriomyces semiglobifer]
MEHPTAWQVRRVHQQARIEDVLKENGLTFKTEHMVDFRCAGTDGSRAYIDFLVEVNDEEGKLAGFVLLEVEEHQHSSYSVSCEVRRMADVHHTLVLEGNTINIAFIRYNPHAFQRGRDHHQDQEGRPRKEVGTASLRRATTNTFQEAVDSFFNTSALRGSPALMGVPVLFNRLASVNPDEQLRKVDKTTGKRKRANKSTQAVAEEEATTPTKVLINYS